MAQIGIDDKSCAALETPGGQVFKATDRVVELPDREAEKFLQSGAPHLHRHHKCWGGVSFDKEGRIIRE